MSEPNRFDFIVDAWALLAFIGSEAGSERVRDVLNSAESKDYTLGMSIINLGEVAYIVERERGIPKVHATLAAIHSLPITLLPADEKVVLTAAHIKASHRLSYADGFAAATVQIWGGRLLTGDPELYALDGKGISVEWIPH